MDVQVAFYHGIRHQIRRVIEALGPERTDKGLTAFEDGASNWSQCFFARALAPEVNLNAHDPEGRICETLGLMNKYGKPNRVPVRLVYFTFDGMSKLITKNEMYEFISSIRDESRPSEVMELLKRLDYTGVEDRPAAVGEECATKEHVNA